MDDVIALSTSADGEVIASASLDGSVRIWPTRMGGAFATATNRPMWRLARVGSTLASLAKDGTVSVWDIGKRHERVLGKSGVGTYSLAELIQRPVVSPDETWVATMGTDNDLLLFRSDGSGSKHLRGLGGAVRAASFSPDGRSIVAAGTDGRAMIWEIESERGRAVEGVGAVSVAAFAADGRHLGLATSKGLVLRDLASGTDVETPAETRSGALIGMMMSPDGSVVVGVGLQNAFLWDRARDRVLTSDGARQVVMVAFSADSKQVAAACGDRVVRVWNLETGAATVLSGHTDFVYEVAFVDDNRLVSSSYDRTVRIWDLASQQSLVLWGHAGAAVGLAVLDSGPGAVGPSVQRLRC
jgi:WD40 repeat protein